ncbi:hypothetical protein IAE22_32145, partial [Bacillus sp. S34]|nr:hypothetical protein [Bacillus sp. S34]
MSQASKVGRKGNIIVRWITSTDHKTIGYMYLIASFLAVLIALRFVDPAQLADRVRAKRGKGQIMAGIHYVRTRPDIIVVLCMIFVVGTFGMVATYGLFYFMT